MSTGDQILGTHSLDLLSVTSNSEIFTVGTYSLQGGSYGRFYQANNINNGFFWGLSNNGAAIWRPDGAKTKLAVDGTIVASNITTTNASNNLYFSGSTLYGVCNIILAGSIYDMSGNQMKFGGGGGGVTDQELITTQTSNLSPVKASILIPPTTFGSNQYYLSPYTGADATTFVQKYIYTYGSNYGFSITDVSLSGLSNTISYLQGTATQEIKYIWTSNFWTAIGATTNTTVRANKVGLYNSINSASRTIITNDTVANNRVLFSFNLYNNYYVVSGTIKVDSADASVLLDSTNWANINLYNSTPTGYISVPVLKTYHIVPDTTPQIISFTFYVDGTASAASSSLTGNGYSYVIAISGVGQSMTISGAPSDTYLEIVPMTTARGNGVDDQVSIRQSIQLNPVRQVFTVSNNNTYTFTVSTTGNFSSSPINTDVYINGTKYVYSSAVLKDYDILVNYNLANNTTTFTIILTYPAGVGDIVEVSVWPYATTSNYYYSGYFYQTALATSTPWLNVAGGGIRYTGTRTIIDGDLIIQGAIYAGSNTANFYSGSQFSVDSLSVTSNVIGTLNIIDASVTPSKLNLVSGNVGIGTLSPGSKLTVIGGGVSIGSNVTAPTNGLIVSSNVGIGTTVPQKLLHVAGDVRVDGGFYNSSNQPIWVPVNALSWTSSTQIPPTFVTPSIANFAYTASNGLYRWMGSELVYNVRVAGTLLTTQTQDFTIQVPTAVNLANYQANTIVGNLYLAVYNGTNSNTFPAFARVNTGNANILTIKALTGTVEESLSTITAGSTISLNGTIVYATTTVAGPQISAIPYVPPKFSQDQYGNVLLNGTSNTTAIPRGLLDIYNNSNAPALVVDQIGSGDLIQVKKNGATNVIINNSGQMGIGTIAPVSASTLHVVGNLQVDGNVSAGNMHMFRNRIINGDMRIDQRNAGAVVTNAAGVYTLDRYLIGKFGTLTMNVQQVNTPATLTGFQKCLKISVGTQQVTLGSSDYSVIVQPIEGLNIADLMWGTSVAQSITVSFWIYASNTGTFSTIIRNGSALRSYVNNFTVSIANTWQYITVTIPGDITGIWNTDNTAGIYFTLCFGTGTNLQTTTNTWQTGNYFGTASTSNFFANTVGSAIYITGLQLEKGTIPTPFEFRPWMTEYQMCLRYYEKSYQYETVPATSTNIGLFMAFAWLGTGSEGGYSLTFQVPKRATISFRYWDRLGNLSKTTEYSNGTYYDNRNGFSSYTVSEKSIWFNLDGTNNGTSAIHWEATAEL